MLALTKDKFLDPDEAKRLRAMTKGLENRDQIIIQLAFATGARASEILAITKADLDDVEKAVYIRGLKGSRDRTLPLPKSLYNAIVKLEGEKPFDITYSRLHQIWDQFSPNGKKFHSIRHTFAVELYKRTRDIRLVQLALGHKDLRNTMVYVDFVYSQEELRKVLVG
jgi:integrase/recombinase XerC